MNRFEKNIRESKKLNRQQYIDEPVNFTGVNLDGLKTLSLNRVALRNRRIFLESKDTESTIAISAYKSLRTNVLKELHNLNASSFMVTGPVKGVGKTSTSINLAINIARMRNKKVLLIDLDLRHPSIHKSLGIKSKFGIGDVLEGGVALNNAILDAGVAGLYVLPGRISYLNSSELLTSDAMRVLLKQVRNIDKDTVVVFDMPPVLGCDDVSAISPQMEACLMVVEESNTKRVELEESVKKIEDVAIIGYVLNKSSDCSAAKYYY